MTRYQKTAFFAFLIIAVSCVLLVFLSLDELEPAREITDVNHLDGHRIGVLFGWSPDYLLSKREDIKIMRYADVPSMMLALKYNKLDAITLESSSAQYLCAKVPGFKVVNPPIEKDVLVCFFANESAELMSKFDEFVPKFRQTDTYEDIVRRFNNMKNGEYETKRVEKTGSGPAIRAGMTDTAIPFTYIDLQTHELVGSDVEIAVHFANSIDRKIEFVSGPYPTLIQFLRTGRIDFLICGVSGFYRDEVLNSKSALVSKPYFVSKLHFVVLDKSVSADSIPADFRL